MPWHPDAPLAGKSSILASQGIWTNPSEVTPPYNREDRVNFKEHFSLGTKANEF